MIILFHRLPLGGKLCREAAVMRGGYINEKQNFSEENSRRAAAGEPILDQYQFFVSDRAENFYRTLCICDAEAGLEVMAGIDHLHNDFPIGSRVTLSLRGLAVAESRGVLQAGRPPAAGSGYATNYIGSRAALGAVLVRSGEALAAPSPAPLAIPALTESRCGTLVRIDGVRYTPEDLSAATWAGYKRFTDADGNAVYTYVRRYARFADAEVPAGTVSLTGILQYDAAGDGRYILKLRDENDCTH